ncbi:hypothetical protein ACLQ28_07830 [Micromonospora sp. DT201]|uniref:hypothetical protein n=1 Tax=Micromonospora sp. DT201 TaxID=3393442 RepID=UPI003CE781BE
MHPDAGPRRTLFTHETTFQPRAAPGKDLAEVHDYHDPATPILAASLPRRMPGYRALGFTRTWERPAFTHLRT